MHTHPRTHAHTHTGRMPIDRNKPRRPSVHVNTGVESLCTILFRCLGFYFRNLLQVQKALSFCYQFVMYNEIVCLCVCTVCRVPCAVHTTILQLNGVLTMLSSSLPPFFLYLVDDKLRISVCIALMRMLWLIGDCLTLAAIHHFQLFCRPISGAPGDVITSARQLDCARWRC